jgi:hypothetical protein
MDFIEKIFGVDPDGGSGATEMLILVLIVAAIFVVWTYRSKTRRRAGN